jgi:hypothetical protein
MALHTNGTTRLERLEESFNETVAHVAFLQEEIDWRTTNGVYVPADVLDEYEECISKACAFSDQFGFSFDADEYVA